MVSTIALRVDGGANCHVLNEEKYFMLLYKREINCNLACGEKTKFQGVGIAILEVAPGIYLPIAPAYLSTKDTVCTISPGALKRYSGCTKATHEALSHLHILTAKKQSIIMKVKTAAGLDYVRTKIHHFNCPQTTKSQRNRYLICKPSTLKFNERHKKVLAQLSKPHAAAAIAKM